MRTESYEDYWLRIDREADKAKQLAQQRLVSIYLGRLGCEQLQFEYEEENEQV